VRLLTKFWAGGRGADVHRVLVFDSELVRARVRCMKRRPDDGRGPLPGAGSLRASTPVRRAGRSVTITARLQTAELQHRRAAWWATARCDGAAALRTVHDAWRLPAGRPLMAALKLPAGALGRAVRLLRPVRLQATKCFLRDVTKPAAVLSKQG
jgi:hypothetical protein